MKRPYTTPAMLAECARLLGITEEEVLARSRAQGIDLIVKEPEPGQRIGVVCGNRAYTEDSVLVACALCGRACWRDPAMPEGENVCQSCAASLDIRVPMM